MMDVRYPLLLRNVEDLLHERGVRYHARNGAVLVETFRTIFTAEIWRSRVPAMRAFHRRRWHLDEVFRKISGVKHYLWQTVDHEGEVLESFVTKRRDNKAAATPLPPLIKAIIGHLSHHSCP